MHPVPTQFAAPSTPVGPLSDFLAQLMKTWSIGVKLALQITLVITLVMAMGGVLNIYHQERQFVPKSTDDMLGDAFLRMTHYLKNMAQTASAIANGDLRHEVQPTSERDELGTAFQQMSFLREIVSRLMDGSIKLESSSGDFQQVSLLMSDEAQQAAKQIHSVSSNSKQVNQHVTDIATAAMQIANSTTASIATAVEQQHSPQSYISENMTNIANSSADTTDTMSNIAEVSNHISEQATYVQNAAEELNALSGQLNDVVGQFKV